MKHIARICCLIVLLWSFIPVSAQNGINSPFSQYGVGLSNMPHNFPNFAQIGGVAYTRASHNLVNPFNPASYAAVGVETFVFDMGLNIETTRLRNNDISQRDGDGNLGYLAVAFPLAKWWKTAFAVLPFSDVNYESAITSAISPGDVVRTVYDGSGSVSQFLWGNGFNIIGGNDANATQLRIGFNINLLYGNISRGLTYDFPYNDTSYFMNKRRQKETAVKNVFFDFGAQYERPLGEKYRLMAGLTITPKLSMTITENTLVYTFVEGASSEWLRDTIFPLPGGDSEYESTLEKPFSIGLGLSLQRNDRWLVALDATFASWSGMKYTENEEFDLFGNSPIRYDNNQRFALGLQLLGDKNASSYLRRITFSAGAHYENGRLNLQLGNGETYNLNEWGVAIGASLPMRKGRSSLAMSVAYSNFGETDLLCKDAIMFGISIGSCESWFVKRKFN